MSLLEVCNKLRGDSIPLPPSIEVEDKEEFKVEEILNSKIQFRKLQYLIKWLGYPNTDNK